MQVLKKSTYVWGSSYKSGVRQVSSRGAYNSNPVYKYPKWGMAAYPWHVCKGQTEGKKASRPTGVRFQANGPHLVDQAALVPREGEG